MSKTNFMNSEVVYYFGDRFGLKGSMLENKDELPSGEKVGIKKLADLMVLSAFVYLLDEGFISLFIKDVKKLFVFNGKDVVAQKQKNAEGLTGLEKSLFNNLSNETSVNHMVYHLLNMEVFLPWSDVIAVSKNSLVAKGLLSVEEVKTLIFKSYKYHAVAGKEKEIEPQFESVKEALNKFEKSNSEIYKMVTKAIAKGINDRQEKPDSDD